VAGQPLEYGKSITDPCIGWEDSVVLLDGLADAVRRRRAARKSGQRAEAAERGH
jgi:3-deoxy-7-phosphoheptulonate synthase